MPKQSLNNTQHPAKSSIFIDDVILISLMAILAGCGLIYEYLLSHYASRVLGAFESTIFAMIGIMIVAMGVGSFAAKKLQNAYSAFAWLEFFIALLGLTSVLIVASLFALSFQLPQFFVESYGLPSDLSPQGGVFESLQQIARVSPYVVGFVLGMLIGMEIPLIARIREHIHRTNLKHNTGTIYGADYIGAGIGAAVWVWFMLSLDNSRAAAFTASANLLVGLIFYWRYQKQIRFSAVYLLSQLGLLILLLLVFMRGADWEMSLENSLYKDKVIFSQHTNYQHISVTERIMSPDKPKVNSLFINGRLQFSSIDEHVYHEMLVHPAMLATANHDEILLIGGGDGLALREILRWSPKHVSMLELDKSVIEFFSKEKFDEQSGRIVNQSLLDLNQKSLSDPRVEISYGDAFNSVDALLQKMKQFNVIIIDLPDPSHPDLNKLYSTRFYEKLLYLLKGDGSLVIQSTSPYHARKAFISIGKTVKTAGFANVEQYHENVPSFGDWGWTIATKFGHAASERIRNAPDISVNSRWITKDLISKAFVFPKEFGKNAELIKVNTLNSYTLYQYHQEAWKAEQGVLNFENE